MFEFEVYKLKLKKSNHSQTRMHSSRMRTVRNSSRLHSGGLHTPPAAGTPPEQTPQSRHIPLGADAPLEQTPRGTGSPPRADPPCCKACWDTTCNACWDSTPPVNRIMDTCKNITFATSLQMVIRYKTRMHSSRMRTTRSLTISLCVVVSHAHPPEQPCMPP